MNIQRKHPNTKAKQIGRGGKRGKTSGRGHKGQRQHGGHGIRPEIRDMIKKLPKLRGYRFNSIKADAFPINVSQIESSFSDGDKVNPTELARLGLVKSSHRNKTIKILGNGDLTKKIELSGCVTSATARAKIEKAGGTVIG